MEALKGFQVTVCAMCCVDLNNDTLKMLGTHFSYSEAVIQRCSVKKALPATLLKRRLWHRCFPMNFAKFLRTSFFTEHLWWLLLSYSYNEKLKERKTFAQPYQIFYE